MRMIVVFVKCPYNFIQYHRLLYSVVCIVWNSVCTFVSF